MWIAMNVRHLCWLLSWLCLQWTAHAAFSNADCLDCHTDPSNTRTVKGHAAPLALFDTNQFSASVHTALLCVDCHEGIKDLVHDTPLPPVSCGSCHEQAEADYAASVHGIAAAAKARESPRCVDCHSEHRTESFKGAASLAISAEVCSKCHASERINTKFDLPADRVKTFFESYHGLAGSYGSTLAANCASCHGYHKILPSTDVNSTIHRTNLVATCGKCHPGANENFSLSKIHVDLGADQNGNGMGNQINWWVRRIYLLLIIVTIGGMFAHNFLLFVKKVAAHLRTTGRPVMRMNVSQRWQHALLAMSFIALAVTGFALKFPDSWLAKLMGSSEPFRSWSHRVAGILLLLVGVYHLIYIAVSKNGRKLVFDFLPVKKDLADIVGTARWLIGLRKRKPQIGRFGYAEKMEYWAVVWGTIIMGVTGLMVWFKMEVTQWLPRWAVDVALTIHYYEAILACLAIVVWHFYHVMFDPDVYPVNLACLDGKVSRHWQKEEHPLEVIEPGAMQQAIHDEKGSH